MRCNNWENIKLKYMAPQITAKKSAPSINNQSGRLDATRQALLEAPEFPGVKRSELANCYNWNAGKAELVSTEVGTGMTIVVPPINGSGCPAVEKSTTMRFVELTDFKKMTLPGMTAFAGGRATQDIVLPLFDPVNLKNNPSGDIAKDLPVNRKNQIVKYASVVGHERCHADIDKGNSESPCYLKQGKYLVSNGIPEAATEIDVLKKFFKVRGLPNYFYEVYNLFGGPNSPRSKNFSLGGKGYVQVVEQYTSLQLKFVEDDERTGKFTHAKAEAERKKYAERRSFLLDTSNTEIKAAQEQGAAHYNSELQKLRSLQRQKGVSPSLP